MGAYSIKGDSSGKIKELDFDGMVGMAVAAQTWFALQAAALERRDTPPELEADGTSA